MVPITECSIGITDKSPAQGPEDRQAGTRRGEGRVAITAPLSAPPDGQEAYAPGHGPGVATSGSTSVFVSKSRKPRRR